MHTCCKTEVKLCFYSFSYTTAYITQPAVSGCKAKFLRELLYLLTLLILLQRMLRSPYPQKCLVQLAFL